MQWFFMPVYYVPRTGRFPHVQSHLGAKSISSFLIVLVSSALSWFLTTLFFH